ncbi:unnamed protein product [Prorocentrum cordatum]|uniref:Methyltransferase domain-containing protein n=1 Tax=Prorocentrum cordatum TaxID=2364126 RepID=A0ABN9WY26_9DINO|nr:unnamed protein product [Polarella glacialis]
MSSVKVNYKVPVAWLYIWDQNEAGAVMPREDLAWFEANAPACPEQYFTDLGFLLRTCLPLLNLNVFARQPDMLQLALTGAINAKLALWKRADGTLHVRWAQTDPVEFRRATENSGRLGAVERVGALVSGCQRVLDLGCGPGLLARESGRRDIVGVDMSPKMVGAARAWMDLVLQENLLEHYPSEPVDAVVLCNVLEPYPPEVRRLLLGHALESLRPGGMVVVVVAARGGGTLGSGGDGGLDIVFPTVPCGAASPEDIEDDLQLVGLELACAELVDTRPAPDRPGTASAAGPSEEAPKADRRSYAIVVGRRAG